MAKLGFRTGVDIVKIIFLSEQSNKVFLFNKITRSLRTLLARASVRRKTDDFTFKSVEVQLLKSIIHGEQTRNVQHVLFGEMYGQTKCTSDDPVSREIINSIKLKFTLFILTNVSSDISYSPLFPARHDRDVLRRCLMGRGGAISLSFSLVTVRPEIATETVFVLHT